MKQHSQHRKNTTTPPPFQRKRKQQQKTQTNTKITKKTLLNYEYFKIRVCLIDQPSSGLLFLTKKDAGQQRHSSCVFCRTSAELEDPNSIATRKAFSTRNETSIFNKSHLVRLLLTVGNSKH